MRNLLVVAVACGVLAIAAPRAEAGNGKKLLPLLGADAQAVFVVDVADARDAATFETLIDKPAPKLAALIAQLEGFGIDVRRDLDTLVIGGHGATAVVILEGRFTKPQLAAVRAIGEARKHRGVAYRADADSELAVLGKRVVIATPGEMKGVIDRHKKKGRSLTRSADAAGIRAAIALVDSRHDAWIAVSGEVLGGAGALGLEALTFAATFGADLTLEVRGQVVDAEHVLQMTQAVDQGLPQVLQGLEQLGLKSLASTFALEWDGLVFDVGATAPDDELETLLGLVAMM